MKQKLFGKIGLFAALLIVGVGIGVAVKFAIAASGDNVTKFIWGGGSEIDGSAPFDNTNTGVRWISLNNTSVVPVADTVPYGVNIPTGNSGAVTGYAWGGGDANGEGIGWIDFDSPSHCVVAPSVPNLALQQYQSVSCIAPDGSSGGVSRSDVNLVGWARVVSIAQASVTGNNGGWDGWISLGKGAGNPSADRVYISGTQILGSAWSSELGWFNFGGLGGNAEYSSSSTLKICPLSDCSGGTPYNTLPSFGNIPVTLYACYGTGTCSTGDSPVSGTWSAIDDPKDAIAISAASGTSTDVSRTYTGTSSAEEDITLIYNTDSVTARAHVSCVSLTCDSGNIKTQTDTYCPSETRTFSNGCGGQTAACPGTRYCDFNWKEVAPGQ